MGFGLKKSFMGFGQKKKPSTPTSAKASGSETLEDETGEEGGKGGEAVAATPTIPASPGTLGTPGTFSSPTRASVDQKKSSTPASASSVEKTEAGGSEALEDETAEKVGKGEEAVAAPPMIPASPGTPGMFSSPTPASVGQKKQSSASSAEKVGTGGEAVDATPTMSASPGRPGTPGTSSSPTPVGLGIAAAKMSIAAPAAEKSEASSATTALLASKPATSRTTTTSAKFATPSATTPLSAPPPDYISQADALCRLGDKLYLDAGRNGDSRYHADAYAKYLQAAELGSADAMMMVARMHLEPHAKVLPNLRLAKDWLIKGPS
mmetsp:Transcript_97098/g.277851  ORF Transcript_97098/g.277851 Transcript_97098/m.277851 type:complete len:322 (+) Transcript_97098:386-1351(+)